MGVYLRAKFEVSSIILITFRRRGGGGGVILTGNINSLSEAIRIYQENLKKSTIKFYTSKQYKILFEFHIFPKTSCPWLHIQSNLQKQRYHYLIYQETRLWPLRSCNLYHTKKSTVKWTKIFVSP